MPVKIRLSKKGRKKLPFYHIVVADSRAPRDGKFVERIGLYNPQTNPATIELNFDSALDWLQKGAQPTDTCRAILSEKGVMMKKHLLEGAKKGAFTAEEAEVRFQKWLGEKQAKVKAQMDSIVKGKADESTKRLAAETKVKEAKAQELAKKLKAQAEESKAVTQAEETKAEEPVEVTVAAEPVEETVAAEPVEETIAEVPVEETISEVPVEETIAVEPEEESKTVEPVEKPVADAADEAAPEKPGESTEA
jgi:small subunit ribosomal protein S16